MVERANGGGCGIPHPQAVLDASGGEVGALDGSHLDGCGCLCACGGEIGRLARPAGLDEGEVARRCGDGVEARRLPAGVIVGRGHGEPILGSGGGTTESTVI